MKNCIVIVNLCCICLYNFGMDINCIDVKFNPMRQLSVSTLEKNRDFHLMKMTEAWNNSDLVTEQKHEAEVDRISHLIDRAEKEILGK